jgi:hypothetical protein
MQSQHLRRQCEISPRGPLSGQAAFRLRAAIVTFPSVIKDFHLQPCRDPWKRWVESRYGLSLGRDSVRDLARQCRHHARSPK